MARRRWETRSAGVAVSSLKALMETLFRSLSFSFLLDEKKLLNRFGRVLLLLLLGLTMVASTSDPSRGSKLEFNCGLGTVGFELKLF